MHERTRRPPKNIYTPPPQVRAHAEKCSFDLNRARTLSLDCADALAKNDLMHGGPLILSVKEFMGWVSGCRGELTQTRHGA